MKGKYVYVAIGAAFGVLTMIVQYHFLLIICMAVYVVYLFLVHSKQLAYSCFIVIFVFAVFAARYDVHNKTTISSNETAFFGIVHTTPIIDGDILRFILLTNGEKVQMSYKLQGEAEKEYFQFLKVGSYIHIQGTLEEPPTARNHHQFDYQHYLYKNRIHHLLKASQLSPTTAMSYNIYYIFLGLRQRQLQYIRHHFPVETIPFVESLIYGERQQFSKEVEEWYEELGLVHLLAISGSHITLLIAGGYYGLLRAGLTKENATIFLRILIPIYMILAGGSPSVIRASFVGIIVLLTFFTTSKMLAIDMLSIVFMFMLLMNPYQLSDVGFLLSFLTSFSLIVSAHVLASFPPLVAFMMVTIIAQLSVLPITLFYFYEISPYSVLLNALFIPFISFLILPLCLLSLCSSFFFPPIGMLMMRILTYLIALSNQLLAYVAELPFANLIFGKPSSLWMIGFYLLLIGFYIGLERSRNRRLFALGMFILLTLQWLDTDSSIKVTIIDVGQGDCILLQLAEEVYLIDTGGILIFPKENWQRKKEEYDVGKKIVVPYLKSQGVRRLDKLILTHGDADHMGAASEIMRELDVKEVVVGEKMERSSLEEYVLQEARKQQIKMTTVKAGDSWTTSEQIFYVLAPFGDEQEENDRSIVLYTAIGPYKWLFTGDISERGEKRLLEYYTSLEADVLKIGHHGSNTSSSEVFLEKVNPKIALIAVGVDNRYNHPHQEVIDRLQHIVTLRTDEHGMIIYDFFQGQGTFSVYFPYDEAKAK